MKKFYFLFFFVLIVFFVACADEDNEDVSITFTYSADFINWPATVAVSNVRMSGSFNSWVTDDTGYEFTKEGNVFTLVKKFEKGTTISYKFLANKQDGTWGWLSNMEAEIVNGFATPVATSYEFDGWDGTNAVIVVQ